MKYYRMATILTIIFFFMFKEFRPPDAPLWQNIFMIVIIVLGVTVFVSCRWMMDQVNIEEKRRTDREKIDK